MRWILGALLVGALMAGCVNEQGSANGESVAQTEEDQSRSNGTTLQEIAEATSGQPGERIPLCPDAATVRLLKVKSIEFGPCDPYPESGQRVQSERPVSAGDGDSSGSGVICTEIQTDRGPVNLDVDLGCAEGLELISSNPVEHDGQLCMKVTYIPRAGEPAVTRYFCPDSNTKGRNNGVSTVPFERRP
jgi:hypothetical protein